MPPPMVKDPRTYEHVRRTASATAAGCWSPTRPGKSNILAELERIGVAVDKDDPRVDAPARCGEGKRGDGLCL